MRSQRVCSRFLSRFFAAVDCLDRWESRRTTPPHSIISHPLPYALATAFLVAAMFFLASTASAANVYWRGTSGDWSDATCWGGTAPTSSDMAYINNGGTASVSSTGGTCNYLYLGNAAGESGAIAMTSGTLTMSKYEYIGYSGVGTFSQSGGVNFNPSGNIYLGYNAGSSGTYNLGGTAVLTSSYGCVGSSGTGTFNQTGGKYSNGIMYLGYNAGSSGTYALSGSATLLSNAEYIGYSGVGAFTQSGGSNKTDYFSLGFNAGSTGTYTLSGTSLLSVTSHESIGSSGLGIFNQEGGTNITALSMGVATGSTGIYNLTGGLLSASSETVGKYGSGSLFQTGGKNSISNSLTLGEYSGSTGTYTMSGGLLASSSETIGSNGIGRFSQSGGTHSLSGILSLGAYTDSTGTYSLSGTSSLTISSSGYLHIGGLGDSRFEWLGGTLTTPKISLVNNGTLAICFDFSMDSLVSGSLFHGTTFSTSTVAPGRLEITNGATVTQSDASSASVTGVQVILGSAQGSGTYKLATTQNLTGGKEFVGVLGTGAFNQSGGSHTVSYLHIGENGEYLLSGGTLNVAGGFVNKGIFNCEGSGEIVVSTASIVDLSGGSILNAGSKSLSVPTGSLVVVSFDHDPASTFGSYTNAGMTHVVGTTLTVADDQGFGGVGDIDDLVVCSGTITATSGYGINLNNGLILFGSGNINLGTGNLTVNDAISCLTGGSLTLTDQYAGKNYTGSFSQTGGTNSLLGVLNLGFNSGDTGTYTLSEAGLLTVSLSGGGERIGNNGTGSFIQRGGSNVTPYLYVGYKSGANGTYTMSGSSYLSSAGSYIGYYGNGTFSQSGGSHILTNAYATPNLYLGSMSGSTGIYNLSGTGFLSSTNQYIGQTGVGIFNQSGGTNVVSTSLRFGSTQNSSGTYNLSGSGSLSAPVEFIGDSGTGSFIQTGGTNSV